jgi:hypothetical protein
MGMLAFAWTLETGAGFWEPLALVVVMVVAILITLAIRSIGEQGFKKGTRQEVPFISGNVPEEEDTLVKGSNLYWGFVEAFKGLYDKLVPLHTGVATDYVLWGFATMAVIIVIGLLA